MHLLGIFDMLLFHGRHTELDSSPEGGFEEERALYKYIHGWCKRKLKNKDTTIARRCQYRNHSDSNCHCVSQLFYDCQEVTTASKGCSREPEVVESTTEVEETKESTSSPDLAKSDEHQHAFEQLLPLLKLMLSLSRDFLRSPKSQSTFVIFCSIFDPVKAGSPIHRWAPHLYTDVAPFCVHGLRLLINQAGRILGSTPSLQSKIHREGLFFPFEQHWLTMRPHKCISEKRKLEGVSQDAKDPIFKTQRKVQNKPTACAVYVNEKAIPKYFNVLAFLMCIKVWLDHPERKKDIVSRSVFAAEYCKSDHYKRNTSALSSFNTHLTDCNKFLELGLLLVGDVAFTPERSGVVMEMRDRHAYFCDEQQCFIPHHGDVNACSLEEEALESLHAVFERSYDLDGNLRNMANDGLPRIVKKQASVNSNKKLKYVSSIDAKDGHGMASLMGMEPNNFDLVFPALKRLRKQLHQTVREMITAAAAKLGVAASDYKLRDDFGFLRSHLELDDLQVQLFHVDWAHRVLKYARELTHLLYLSFFPVTKSGMWLRIMPEPPVTNAGKLDKSQKTEWSHQLGVVGCSCQSPKDKIEGRWLYIPYGSMVVVPASLYHAGHIRTSSNGNPRGHFYVFAENTKRKSLLQLQGELRVKENLDQFALFGFQDYIEKTSKKEPCTTIVVEAKGGDINIMHLKDWRTDGLKTFCKLFYL